MAQDRLPIQKDDNNRVISAENSKTNQHIKGPLGLWPFPILNFLMQLSNNDNDRSTVITEIHRDDDGRINAIEEFEL